MRLNPFSTTAQYNDTGLLIMRVVAAFCLLSKHGVEKAFDFHTMATSTVKPFPDPFHLGVVPSLFIAMLSDFVCAILIILGLGTRFAAAFSFTCIAVAWVTVHHFSFFEPRGDHGEIMILMLGAFAGLLFTGPGRFSLDHLISRRRTNTL